MNISPLNVSPRRKPDAGLSMPSTPRALPAYARRERDFGVGYGRSSGYASDKRYTRDWGNTRFRFA